MKCLSLNLEASETIEVCPVENNKFPCLSAIGVSSLGQGICLMTMTVKSKASDGIRMRFSILWFGSSGGDIRQQFQWPRLFTHVD